MYRVSVPRACWFCPQIVKKGSQYSREHTIPQWLQQNLGIASQVIEPTLTAMPSAKVLDSRKHTVDKLRTGAVCQSCNSGWMSRLESDVQSLLLDLISGVRPLQALRKAERLLLARWATKTAYMFQAGSFEHRIPRTHFTSLRDVVTNLPDGVHVFGRQQEFDQLWYIAEGSTWLHPALEESAAVSVKTTGYKISLQFGQLLLVVVYWPLRGWNLRVEKNMLFKIWPRTSQVVSYVNSAPMNSDTSERAHVRFTAGVTVSPTKRADGIQR